MRAGVSMPDQLDAFKNAVHAVLGASPAEFEPGRFCRFSTGGKPSDKAGWCHLFPDGRTGVFGDFRAGISEVWTAAPCETMTAGERTALRRHVTEAKAQRERVQREAWRKNEDRNRFNWRQTRPVTAGDPVHAYLRRRLRVDKLDVPECVRFHPAMPYFHEGESLGTFPCMVAPLVDGSGRMLALHRTFLTEDGRKASVPVVRKLTGACALLAGSSIPLAQPLDGRIGAAEGLETALAAQFGSGVPTVAAYSAGNLAAYRWHRSVQRLVVFGDNDPAGIRAANELHQRAIRAGLQSSIATPSDSGADWLDVWASRGDQGVSV